MKINNNKKIGVLTICLYLLPAPNDKMKEVLMKTVEAAKALISKVSISFLLFDSLRFSF